MMVGLDSVVVEYEPGHVFGELNREMTIRTRGF